MLGYSRFQDKKILNPVQTCPQMAVFGESGSLNVKLLVLNPQKTFLRRIASFDVFCIKVATGVFTVSDWKNPKTKKNS